MFKALLAVLLSSLLLHTNATLAQEFNPDASKPTDIHPTDVILWSGIQALADDKGQVLIGLRLETRQEFSVYKSKLEFRGPAGYALGVQTAPAVRTQEDPLGEGPVDVYDGGDFEIRLKGDKPFTEGTLSLAVTSTGCTGEICLLPFTVDLKIPVYQTTEDVSGGAMVASAESDAEVVPEPAEVKEPATISKGPIDLSVEEEYAEKLKAGELSFALLLLVVFIGGIATNLTPCVFPMIPITLRLLARPGHRPLSGTLLYASGIIATYTGLGLLASLSGGLFGSILANPWVNVGFALIFLVLGITMLGFGNLSKLQNIGAQLGSGHSSLLNSFGMGAGAGLVAAPCTGPIMGALLAYSTQLHDLWKSLLLFFLYSLGFALPYIFLGLAAKRVASFKLSAKIQVGTKMIFAAAMFGLAAYYLKNPAHEVLTALNGYWLWIAIAFAVIAVLGFGAILSSAHRMHSKQLQLLPALLMGIALFGLVQNLTGNDLASKLEWHKEEVPAYMQASLENKAILVDGWADWCVACKKMDQSTFHDPEVISLLHDDWVLVKLDLTELNESNEALALKYDMQGLPTLVLIPANGDLTKSKKLTGYVSGERLLQELKSFQGR